MFKGHRIQNGIRIASYAPDDPIKPPEQIKLPDDHHCRGCPVIVLSVAKPYCFLPGCLRQEFEEMALGKPTLTEQSEE